MKRFDVNIVMFSVFIMWGGIGMFNAPSAFELGGVLKIQDLLVGLVSIYLFVYTLKKSGLQCIKKIMSPFGFLMIYGMVLGFLNGNKLINIAFEARIFVYLIIGLIVGMNMKRDDVLKSIVYYAIVVSLMVIIQWILLIVGVKKIFINGVNLGNEFSIGLPLIRPSSFHLLGVASAIIFSPWSPWKNSLITKVVAVLALVITQSKTYWLILIGIILIINGYINFKRVVLSKKISKSYFFGVILVINVILFAIITSSYIPAENKYLSKVILMPYEKFKVIFVDNEIAYGVIGKRVAEAWVMLKEWRESLVSMLFGKGLGFVYRDIGMFYFRVDIRDAERLAMFGHNFFLWLLLKFGIFGLLIFWQVIFKILKKGIKGDEMQKIFVMGLMTLIIGSVALGSIEELIGSFMFGLLLAGTFRV